MRKNFDVPFEIKELTDQGKFSGIASIYGAVDLGGDVVERGAFSKSLSENPTVPILWHHKSEFVIGEGKMHSTREGLIVDGNLDIDFDPTAQNAFHKMKRGRVKGLSIGYQSIKDEVKNGIRHLLELKLWEISIVPFPMLPGARITSVKTAEEISEFLEALWVNEAGVKAAIAGDEGLKQKFLSLLGEAGSTTSTKRADVGSAEPDEVHSRIAAILSQRSAIHGTQRN